MHAVQYIRILYANSVMKVGVATGDSYKKGNGKRGNGKWGNEETKKLSGNGAQWYGPVCALRATPRLDS